MAKLAVYQWSSCVVGSQRRILLGFLSCLSTWQRTGKAKGSKLWMASQHENHQQELDFSASISLTCGQFTSKKRIDKWKHHDPKTSDAWLPWLVQWEDLGASYSHAAVSDNTDNTKKKCSHCSDLFGRIIGEMRWTMVDPCNIHITIRPADSGRTTKTRLVIEGVPQLMAHSSMKVKRFL